MIKLFPFYYPSNFCQFFLSKSISKLEKFISIIDKRKLDRIYEKLKQLEQNNKWNPSDHDTLEKCDVEFTRELTKADEKCIIPIDAWWNDEVHKRTTFGVIGK